MNDNSAQLASEIGYIGSFIIDPEFRNTSYFPKRSMILKPEDMHDPFSKGVLEAIMRLNVRNERATIDEISRVMTTEGIINGNDNVPSQIDTWEKLQSALKYYSQQGAVDTRGFRVRENAVSENWRSNKLTSTSISKLIESMKKKGATNFEIAIALKEYAENVSGGGESAAITADHTRQIELLKEIPERQRELLGKPRFTFPPHWGVNHLVPYLKTGIMITMSGGTGDGKSAMAMQFADWACIAGKNVLAIILEDQFETILMRQTVRWVGGTMDELERGDPHNKMAEMSRLREKWARSGGQMIYKYLAGNPIESIKTHIKEVARELELQGKSLDVVVMDYFQKVDFDSGVKNGANYVNVATKGAEDIKILAETLGFTMMVVSQETEDAQGNRHAAWTRALEQKAQIYISLSRNEIKRVEDEEVVTITVGGQAKSVPLAKVGDRSCWLKLQFKKVNNGRQGIQWLFFEGPRFRAFEPNFMNEVESMVRDEFSVPILQKPDEKFFERQKVMTMAYKEGYKTLKNPDDKKRNS